MQGAWKVGLLVVVFGALFMGVYAVLDRSVFAPKTHEYFALFGDAGGVTPGSRVLLAGVRVGQVARVELQDPRQARVVLSVEDKYRIPVGTEAILPSSFIGIGDRQVELVPPLGTTTYLQPGGTLKGSLRSPLESMIPESEATLTALNDTLKATQKLLQDQDLKQGVTKLMASATQTADKFGNLAQSLDRVIAQNQGELKVALSQGTRIATNLAELSDRLTAYAKSGKLEGHVDKLMAQLDQTLSSGNKLLAEMNAIVGDPALRKNLNDIVANTTSMTESGVTIARNAEDISQNGVTLSEKAIEIAEKASALADDLRDALRRFDATLNKLPGAGKSFDVSAEVDLMRETHPNRWRTDLNATIPFGQERLHLGLFDAFESNKLNAQLARPFGPVQLRYGVYASQPGVGVDSTFASRWGLRTDLFGLNDPRFDLRARYDFGKGVVGWVGVDRIFDRNAPSIGLGIRR